MQRDSKLGIAFLLLLTATGCGQKSNDSADSGQVEKGVAPETDTFSALAQPPQLPITDCDPNESGSRPCGNLLPAGWEELQGNALDTIAKILTHLDTHSRSALQPVDRQAGSKNCPNNLQKPLRILLKAPLAMDSFPRSGTNKRDLVISLFDVKLERGCQEFLYGVRQNRGTGRRSIEFSTVTSSGGNAPDGKKRVIGEWRTWSLTMDRTAPRKNFKLQYLDRHGQWTQCGHVHPLTDGDVGFISCAAADTLAARAWSAPVSMSAPVAATALKPMTSFRSLLGEFMKRDSTLLAQMEGDPFSDPAWGRCGSLGCCASEGGGT